MGRGVVKGNFVAKDITNTNSAIRYAYVSIDGTAGLVRGVYKQNIQGTL